VLAFEAASIADSLIPKVACSRREVGDRVAIPELDGGQGSRAVGCESDEWPLATQTLPPRSVGIDLVEDRNAPPSCRLGQRDRGSSCYCTLVLFRADGMQMIGEGAAGEAKRSGTTAFVQYEGHQPPQATVLAHRHHCGRLGARLQISFEISR